MMDMAWASRKDRASNMGKYKNKKSPENEALIVGWLMD